MKHACNVWRICLLTLLGCFMSVSGRADQLTELVQGKVYRFTNVSYPAYSLSVGSLTTAVAGLTSESSKSQLWYVDAVAETSGVKTYRLRSYGNGRYLKGAGTSTQWTLADDADTYLYLLAAGESYNTLSETGSSGGYNKMHCDGGKNIVGWEAGNRGTQWEITEVTTLTEADIAANWESIGRMSFTDDEVSTLQSHLGSIFSDPACTTLTSAYAAMTETALMDDEAVGALPVTLQEMVRKVWRTQSGGMDVATAWAEDHVTGDGDKAWSGDYARRYRVQNYEVYTNRDELDDGLRINIHTNLNNPTGIITRERDILYIMVEGEIKDGATLYLGSYTGHGQGGDATNGVQLHEGLNVIPCWTDRQWTCIYYVATTLQAWDGTTNKVRPLSDFPDLKIHIEGGNVNGYYNEVGDALYAHGRTGTNVSPQGDNEEDWDYLAARNVLDDLTILGKRVVFQFHFNPTADSDGNLCNGTDYYFTTPTDGGDRRVRIPDFLERWNRVVLAQNLTMGLLSREEVAEANRLYPTLDDPSRGVYAWTGDDAEYASDYADYYRMHCLAISGTTGYMSGGWTSSNYNVNTFPNIVGQIVDDAGSGWGPGHEIGHQHQMPFNMSGLTEVTNNLYANICAWYGGLATSRVNGGEGDLTQVLRTFNGENTGNGNFDSERYDFFNNNIWAQTHMYYKLWLYYHLAGKNNKFYPRLFEMLRRDPIVRVNAADGTQTDVQTEPDGTVVTGRTPLLHFYKLCCKAAGEDLTEFFTAYGFFTPMERRFVGDYANAYYTQTQAQIDAVISEVKSWGYPENHTALFINDYTNGATFYSHDGTTVRAFWDSGNTYSDLGAYTDYNGTTQGDDVDGTYLMTAEDGVVTMSGATGGTGFLIYDENGKLIGFSSDYSFPLNEEALLAVAKGTAVVQAVNAEGESVEVAYDGGSAAVSLLAGLLEEVGNVVNSIDDGGTDGKHYTKVGFYRQSEVATLVELYGQAKELYDAGTQSGYISAYEALRAEYDNVLANPYAVVKLIPGSTCVLVNKQSPEYYISESVSGDTRKVASTRVSGGVTVADVPDSGKWIFETTGTEGVYQLRNVANGDYFGTLSQSTALTAGDAADGYVLESKEGGTWMLKYNDNSQRIHLDGWKNIVGWGDTANENSWWYITMVSVDETVVATGNLEMLIDKTKTLMGKMADVVVKGEQNISDFTLSSNATESGHELEDMVDGDPATFFHTVWKDSDLNEDHYFQLDCGEGLGLADFIFSYTTRPVSGNGANADAPQSITITGSNNADAEDAVWTEITTINSGLPTAHATNYTSDVIGSSDTAYRYLRFTVTKTTGNTFNGHYYFGIAELNITRNSSRVNSIQEKYADADLAGNALTKDKLVAVADEICNAKVLLQDADATANDLDARYENLLAQYDILLAAYNAAKEKEELLLAYADLPVKLTTNPDAPHYYRIRVNRDGGDYIWEARPESDQSRTKVKLTDRSGHDLGNQYQAWYFMPASEAPKVYIVNKTTPDMVLACTPTDFAEGAGKLQAIAKDGSFGANEWTISNTNSTEGWYNITTIKEGTTTFYVSNHSGVGMNMGFYNNSTDNGSNFQFMAIDPTRSEAYNTLFNYYHNTARYAIDLTTEAPTFPANCINETAIGYYPQATAEVYVEAYVNANHLLQGEDATDDALTETYEALKTANEGGNAPRPDALYTLRCARSATNVVRCYVSPDDRHLYGSTGVDAATPKAVWQFVTNNDGTYKLRNLHTGLYINSLDKNLTIMTGETGGSFTIEPIGDTKVLLKMGNDMMHAAASCENREYTIENWNYSDDVGSQWYIDEVTTPTDIAYSLNMSAYGYAGFYSAYPVTIPEGLTAYYVENLSTDENHDGTATLQPLTDIIPANTGVILCGNQGTYALSYSAEAGTQPDGNNMLDGSPYLCYKLGEEGTYYYLFGAKGGNVGLYRTWLEYTADGGTTVTNSETEEEESTAGTDDGGYFRVSANKIFMAYTPSVQQNVAGFHFGFGSGEETGIEGVDATVPEGAVIYDLQGRRIGRICSSGLYIINGVKLYIRK